jgi:hypothetical protein
LCTGNAARRRFQNSLRTKRQELADLFRAPDRALALIRQALGKAATAAGCRSQARLVLAIDQMEELFTTERRNRLRAKRWCG